MSTALVVIQLRVDTAGWERDEEGGPRRPHAKIAEELGLSVRGTLHEIIADDGRAVVPEIGAITVATGGVGVVIDEHGEVHT